MFLMSNIDVMRRLKKSDVSHRSVEVWIWSTSLLASDYRCTRSSIFVVSRATVSNQSEKRSAASISNSLAERRHPHMMASASLQVGDSVTCILNSEQRFGVVLFVDEREHPTRKPFADVRITRDRDKSSGPDNDETTLIPLAQLMRVQDFGSRMLCAPKDPVCSKPWDGKWVLKYSTANDGTTSDRTAYAFCSRPFLASDGPIRFRVEAKNVNIVLYIGVTTNKPNKIPSSSLPVDSQSLLCNSNLCRGLFIPDLGCHDEFLVHQRRSHILIERQGHHEGIRLPMSPNAVVYPFFWFGNKNTSVASVHFSEIGISSEHGPLVPFPEVPKSKTSRSRPSQSKTASATKAAGGPTNRNKCLVCTDGLKEFMCSPCNHVVFCELCKKDYDQLASKECPVCRSSVRSVERIFY